MPAELNDTFYPILLSSMREPLASAEAEDYFKKLIKLADEAIRTGQRHVVIVVSDVTKFSAAGRKHVAEAQARLLTVEQNDVTLAAFVPIDSAVVRGAVTALRWLAPNIVKSIYCVPSVRVAFDEALRALEANGTPFTGDRQALRRALGLPG